MRDHGHFQHDAADDPDGLWDEGDAELSPLPISQARQISYGEWGEQFFAAAISDDRIRGAVSDLAGQPINFGPMGVGPGRIAKVTARGQIGDAILHRHEGFPVTYDLTVPVDLTFEVDLKLETERFDAQLEVPIRLIGRAVDGVRIYIEAQPPHNSEVSVQVKADGRRAEWLRRIAGVDDELRRFVAKYVTRELDKPAIRRAREVEVIPLMDKAWSAAPAD
ncbi:MAG TPA: hypothetical protein VNZ66_08315 [Aeromicrobium sp.]|nr:hypothetical protein [Aeromicrobium sp.]